MVLCIYLSISMHGSLFQFWTIYCVIGLMWKYRIFSLLKVLIWWWTTTMWMHSYFFRMKTTKFNMLSLIKPTNIISIVLCQFCHSFSIRKRNINILLNAADWIQGSAFNSFEMPKHLFIRRKFHITFIQLLDQE